MGNRIACSDLFATSTEAMTEEEDIVTTFCSKKTLCLFCQHPQLIGGVIITQQISFLFPLILLCIFQDLTRWV